VPGDFTDEEKAASIGLNSISRLPKFKIVADAEYAVRIIFQAYLG